MRNPSLHQALELEQKNEQLEKQQEESLWDYKLKL